MSRASPGLATPVGISSFHFEPRQTRADWRHLCALDVERVAREVDVAALQEHITGVTFCNLDGEQCVYCRKPLDSSLLKVFRMAQLTIEYLLHCQQVLETSLATHTQRLQAAQAELAHTRQQAAKQVMKLQLAEQESRIWKKLIVSQQHVLQAGPNTRCKCHFCSKAFKKSSLLREHLKRRHVETTKAEKRKLKKVKQMECEVKELKVKLWEMQQQLEKGKLRREQEMEKSRQQEEDIKNYFEKWKEERTKLHEEIDDLKQLFFTVFKDIGSSAMERKLQDLQAREVVVSNVEVLQKNDTEEQCQAPNQAELCREKERMAMQKENKTLHDIPCQDQTAVMDHVHQQMHDISTCSEELPKKKKIKRLSASKSEVTQEVTKLVADEELPGEEEATLGSKRRLMTELQRNPNLLKQFAPVVEEVLEEKLESMGVKKLRNKFVQVVTEKVKQFRKSNSSSQLSMTSGESSKSPRSLCGSELVAVPDKIEPEDSVIPQSTPQSRNIHSPLETPWNTLQTSKASSTHQGSVQPQKSDMMLGGNRPTLSHTSFRAKQESVLSPVVMGDETDSNILDLMEKISDSGTPTSRPLRPSEKHLGAVEQRALSVVSLFSAASLTSVVTSQFTGETSDMEIFLEDPADTPLGGDREGTVIIQQPLDGATRLEIGRSCSEASPGLISGYSSPSFLRSENE